jgi:hypothetical protein
MYFLVCLTAVAVSEAIFNGDGIGAEPGSTGTGVEDGSTTTGAGMDEGTRTTGPVTITGLGFNVGIGTIGGDPGPDPGGGGGVFGEDPGPDPGDGVGGFGGDPGPDPGDGGGGFGGVPGGGEVKFGMPAKLTGACDGTRSLGIPVKFKNCGFAVAGFGVCGGNVRDAGDGFGIFAIGVGKGFLGGFFGGGPA